MISSRTSQGHHVLCWSVLHMGLVKPQNREWIIVVGTLARWHTWTHMDRKPWQQMQADASRCTHCPCCSCCSWEGNRRSRIAESKQCKLISVVITFCMVIFHVSLVIDFDWFCLSTGWSPRGPADEIGNEIEDLSLPISQMQRASNIFHDRQSLAHAFSIPALQWLCNGRMMF